MRRRPVPQIVHAVVAHNAAIDGVKMKERHRTGAAIRMPETRGRLRRARATHHCAAIANLRPRLGLEDFDPSSEPYRAEEALAWRWAI
jgi:hypothetical protein